jgi:predicted small secreted protein
MNRIVLLLAALLLSVTVSACNTVEGAGQDMQKAGAEVSGEAQEHK